MDETVAELRARMERLRERAARLDARRMHPAVDAATISPTVTKSNGGIFFLLAAGIFILFAWLHYAASKYPSRLSLVAVSWAVTAVTLLLIAIGYRRASRGTMHLAAFAAYLIPALTLAKTDDPLWRLVHFTLIGGLLSASAKRVRSDALPSYVFLATVLEKPNLDAYASAGHDVAELRLIAIATFAPFVAVGAYYARARRDALRAGEKKRQDEAAWKLWILGAVGALLFLGMQKSDRLIFGAVRFGGIRFGSITYGFAATLLAEAVLCVLAIRLAVAAWKIAKKLKRDAYIGGAICCGLFALPRLFPNISYADATALGAAVIVCVVGRLRGYSVIAIMYILASAYVMQPAFQSISAGPAFFNPVFAHAGLWIVATGYCLRRLSSATEKISRSRYYALAYHAATLLLVAREIAAHAGANAHFGQAMLHATYAVAGILFARRVDSRFWLGAALVLLAVALAEFRFDIPAAYLGVVFCIVLGSAYVNLGRIGKRA